MVWRAPDVERVPAVQVGDERVMLQAWLDQHRQTLLWKCRGLTADQLRLRSVEPSTISLLGLVRHLREVEHGWFGLAATGVEATYLYCSESNPHGDFDDIAEADAEQDLADYRRELELCDAAVADLPLEHTFRFHDLDFSLRWVYLHMIEEYARHNGHADLVRERIDGATGA